MEDLKNIKGIGPKSIACLNKLNITTTEDLITYYPYRYEVLKENSLKEEKSIIPVVIESRPSLVFSKKVNILRFRALYKKKLINVVIFNRGYIKNQLVVGNTVTLIGKYEEEKNSFTCNNIKLYDISGKVEIEPVYHLVSGITNKKINDFITTAIKDIIVKDYIPYDLSTKYGFMSKLDAIKTLHFPKYLNKIKEAIIRCKYEELFIFMLKINYLKRRNSDALVGYSKDIDEEKINEFINNIPFKLTTDQLKVVDEIKNDLKSEKRMNRLVEGDVGSGKTIVAMIAMYIMKLNNFQSALMAQTEILAKQHYLNAKELFKDYDVNIELLIGSQTKTCKEKIKEKIKNNEVDIVIGTHTLVQEDISFSNLGLIITDEQHRFGVNQRNSLRNKGNMPDVLYMSATPIPRTYALTIYGDMDISIIKEKPNGRKDVITKVYDNKDVKKVLEKIKEELDLKHQIYIVSPLIENADDDKEDTNKLYRKFSLAFKNKNIAILHGKMKAKEKEEIMNDFKDGKVDILISTTVIEVGVDVFNASMMVIFDSNLFGLATLHQLRGRVGRNDFQCYCLLVSSKETQRLKIMENTYDGFKLAEEDFKLRGYGDLFGTRQSGDMTFKLADLAKDYKMVLKAKEDSEKILDEINNYKDLKEILKKSINMD